jgi:predicted GIY-YIG superfamily endonuclease
MPKVSLPYWVYVIQSEQPRFGKRGNLLPGFFYVGSTTDPLRRLRQHNGEISGGAKYTSKFRPWVLKGVWGPYPDRSSGLRAEMALKRGKRGASRCKWSKQDSPWCPEGPDQGESHPLVLGLSAP